MIKEYNEKIFLKIYAKSLDTVGRCRIVKIQKQITNQAS